VRQRALARRPASLGCQTLGSALAGARTGDRPLCLLANLLRLRSPLPRLRAAFGPYASSGVVTALAQATLFEALDRGRVSVVAPIVGTGVLWTVVFAAIFLGRGELVGRRLFVVALLVVAGSTLVGATR
jgi:drug/metabolite transporter (DMT)-like permease